MIHLSDTRCDVRPSEFTTDDLARVTCLVCCNAVEPIYSVEHDYRPMYHSSFTVTRITERGPVEAMILSATPGDALVWAITHPSIFER